MESEKSKWESVREALANAAKNGWIAFKLQVLKRGTLMRETTLLTTLVTRDKISASDDHVSKCLFPKDVEIKQSIARGWKLFLQICFKFCLWHRKPAH